MSFGNLFVAFLAFFLALPCQGDWASISSSEFELAGPPTLNSEAHERDFRELHRLQNEREQSHCRLAATQQYPTFRGFYGPSAGILSDAEYKRVEPLFKRVFKFSERVAGYFKSRYRRPRPYNVDQTLTPCVHKPSGAKAYPSSHAAVATVGACILSRVFPEKSQRLLEYGDYLGRLRAIVGVHHPSDVEAGQALGTQICERLLSEEDFNEELP